MSYSPVAIIETVSPATTNRSMFKWACFYNHIIKDKKADKFWESVKHIFASSDERETGNFLQDGLLTGATDLYTLLFKGFAPRK